MLYERPEHREMQDRCQWVLEYLGFAVRQTRTECGYDMALRRSEEPYALVEYKTRTNAYPTLKIDQTKIDGLLELSRKHSVKPILIIHWTTLGGYWAWKCHTRCPVVPFKRTKTRGITGELPEKERPAYAIPRSEFILL